MTIEERMKNLSVPAGPVDAVLDTDTYNEVDDQFALAYMLLSGDKINTKAIYAAPFFNDHSSSPKDGMEKSYEEILRVLRLMKREDMIPNVFKGSDRYLPSEEKGVESPAAAHLVDLSRAYTPAHPLYVVAIGAITNVASAILFDPTITERIVVVWLAGRAPTRAHCTEFNMSQDIAAARVVFNSGAPVVQLPCAGVIDRFATTKPELTYWLKGKNALADFLLNRVVDYCEKPGQDYPWSKVIWDVTAVAWLLNDDNRFLAWENIPTVLPDYDNRYTAVDYGRPLMTAVTGVNRDALFFDLFTKLTNNEM